MSKLVRVVLSVAGGLVLACGALLVGCTVDTAADIVDKSIGAPQPTAWRVTLVCKDCADAGMEINLWDSPSRNRVTGQVAHGTRVTVLEARQNVGEGRAYYHVKVGGERGWVPEDFVRP